MANCGYNDGEVVNCDGDVVSILLILVILVTIVLVTSKVVSIVG